MHRITNAWSTAYTRTHTYTQQSKQENNAKNLQIMRGRLGCTLLNIGTLLLLLLFGTLFTRLAAVCLPLLVVFIVVVVAMVVAVAIIARPPSRRPRSCTIL
jgi:hypothetical protein